MKKFWVGLLSIMLLAGGVIFYACGKTKTSIVLSQDSVDICINDDSDHTATLTATVKGTNNGTVTASYSDKVSIEIVPDKQNKTNIVYIEALKPGPAIITLTDDVGGASADFTVNIYQKVTSIEQKSQRSYAVKGVNGQPYANVLDPDQILLFNADDALQSENTGSTQNAYLRKNIVWSIDPLEAASYGELVTLDGDTLFVDSRFREGGSIKLIATDTMTGETGNVSLDVIKQLNKNDITISYSYNSYNFNDINSSAAGEKTKISISSSTSDYEENGVYSAYLHVRYPADDNIRLSRSNTLLSRDGFYCNETPNETRDGNFIVREYGLAATEDFVDLFSAYFSLEYVDYDYSVNSDEFLIECKQFVRDIELLEGLNSVEKSQDIYTSYKKSSNVETGIVTDEKYGKMYIVNLIPRPTDATFLYRITVDYSAATWHENIVDENTLKIAYGDQYGVFGSVSMRAVTGDDAVYDQNRNPLKFEGTTNIASSALYFMANENNVLNDMIDQVHVTIAYEGNDDRAEVSASYTFNLIQSSQSLEFEGQASEKAVLLRTDELNIIDEKYGKVDFVFEGQTRANELHVETEGIILDKDVRVTKIVNGQSDRNISISFKFEVLESARGKTLKGKYFIRHDNGIETDEKFDLELFLPLTNAKVSLQGGAITKKEFDGSLYTLKAGDVESAKDSELSYALMRNGSNAQLFTSQNFVDTFQADAQIEYRFLNYDDAKFDSLDLFKSLDAYQIYVQSQAVSEKAPVVSVLKDDKGDVYLSTKNVGYAYFVVIFAGKDETGNDCVLFRTILIESYIAATQFYISPNDIVSVFAQDSVANGETISESKSLVLGNGAITGLDFKYFKFRSDSYLADQAFSITKGTVLDFVNYKVEIVDFNNEMNSLQFIVTGITTQGAANFKDGLTITYCNSEKENVEFECKLLINIKNADRVESVRWDNSNSAEELYFEVPDFYHPNDPQYLIFSTSPTNAKNNDLRFFATSSDGVDLIRNGTVTISTLADQNLTRVIEIEANKGLSGWLYVLPADAIYDNTINYYFDDEGIRKANSISVEQLSANFDYLTEYAYFINNQGHIINFSDFLIKIKIEVADGSRQHAYRIYNAEQLQNTHEDKHYLIMNDLTLDDWTSKTRVSGSIYGAQLQNGNCVTLTIIGQTFVDVNDGEIGNLNFVGSVSGNGFVANVNNGLITNVTIDVYNDGTSYKPSQVKGQDFVGAIVGRNNGQKSENKGLVNVRALGTSVDGETVGGIAGQNSGSIENARFEIYKFVRTNGEVYTNNLQGTTIGGVVGQLTSGRLFNVYAYDYALSADAYHIGENAGAIAGNVTFAENATAIIEQSFAVVNVQNVIAQTINSEVPSGLTIKDVYLSFYNDEKTYTSQQIGEVNREVWVQTSDSEHQDYVNGAFPYLKDFSQEQSVSADTVFTTHNVTEHGFDKVLAVGTNKALFYYYKIADDGVSLSNQEQNMLNSLNTISLGDLIGDAFSANKLVVLSTDTRFVTAQTSNIVVKGITNDDVELTLYSRHDFSISQTFTIKVIYALSPLTVGIDDTVSAANKVTEIPLQLSKSKQVVYNFSNKTVSLGTSSVEKYTFAMPTVDFKYNFGSQGDQGRVQFNLNANVLDITALSKTMGDRQQAQVYFTIEDLAGNAYQDAIHQAYAHNFDVKVEDGALDIEVSNGKLTISPSSSNKVVATLTTTFELSDENKDKGITPSIFIGDTDVELSLDKDNTDAQLVFEYNGQDIIDVDVAQISHSEQNNIHTYKFEVVIGVNQAYRNQVSESRSFRIVLTSPTEIENSFELIMARQELRNVNMTTTRVSGYKLGSVISESGEIIDARYFYEVEQSPTGIIAPGDSVIVAVYVNPSYASYRHVELTYDGANQLGAVELSHVFKSANGVFYHDTDNTTFANNRLVYTPDQKDKGECLYFLLHTALSLDTVYDDNITLNITARFVDASGQTLNNGEASQPLIISILKSPLITINNSTTGILAKGETATLTLQIPDDTDVELESGYPNLSTNVEGISLSKWQPVSSSNGIRTYTSTITASVKARYVDNASEGAQQEFSVWVTIRKRSTDQPETAQIVIQLVDFKLDVENIAVANSDSDNAIAFNGIETPLIFDYPLLPSEYHYDESDATAKDYVTRLENAKNEFLSKKYYTNYTNAADATGPNGDYFINYKLNSNGEPIRENGQFVPLTMKDNLYYLTTVNNQQQYVPVFDGDSDVANLTSAIFRYASRNNTVTVQGTSTQNVILRMQLRTVVKVGKTVIDRLYPFTIRIETHYDEDHPAIVSTESEFYEMSPNPSDYNNKNYENSGDGSELHKTRDYILMNDIYLCGGEKLNGHLPFDTTYIDSFDGNGFTINIVKYYSDPERPITMALFNNVTNNTTLKNIRVNILYSNSVEVGGSRVSASAGNIKINVANDQHRLNSQIAGFAITNEGIITNCEVVSFDPRNEIKDTGIKVTYTNGENDVPCYTVGRGEDARGFTSSVAGFVVTNNGSITNSRVGGKELTLWQVENTESGYPRVVGLQSPISLSPFSIVAQGNIAGFVLTNNKAIASSYVKNVTIENESATADFDTAGFTVTNAQQGRISTSYVEGLDDEGNSGTVSKLGKGISSKLGVITGFVKENLGTINDDYSNILISNNSDGRTGEAVYLASGFIYRNNGIIENCFSASHVAQQTYTQMNFSGVDKLGNLLATGQYTNNYYFSTTVGDSEKNYNTGAVLVPDLSNKEYFYGFSLCENGHDGVWILDTDAQSLTLDEANNIALSNRYYVASETAVETEYTLPYTILPDSRKSLVYGSENNPIIIRNAEEFVAVTGTSKSSFISQWFKDGTIENNIVPRLSGNYRIVNDINLNDVLTGNQDQLISWQKAFTGSLHGNGFEIRNVAIAETRETLAYGLFASIEGGSIINLDLAVRQVDNSNAPMVGALAGYVSNYGNKKANLVNINVDFVEDALLVQGLNFAGSVAGYVRGDVKLNNIKVNSPNVNANNLSGQGEGYMTESTNYSFKKLRTDMHDILNGRTITSLSTSDQNTIRHTMENYGYAGGIFGAIDAYKNNQQNNFQFEYSSYISDYQVSGLRVNDQVRVVGLVAGGLIGFSGPLTNIKDAGIVLNAPQENTDSLIFANGYYAGGVVGQSMGVLDKIFAEYSADLQSTIEGDLRATTENQSLSSYYQDPAANHERGSTTIFDNPNSRYSPKAIGGLVGLVESGSMTVAYSKLNVTSTRATYAGGVIGAIYTENANTFQSSCAQSVNEGKIFQNYLMDQVYSSGDVRAIPEGATGGIIGHIIAGTITLDAVNNANFFSVYDYQTGEYPEEYENYFEENHIYALAGKIDTNAKLQLKQDDIVTDSVSTSPTSDTVGVVTTYTIGGTDVTLDAYERDNSEGYFQMPNISKFTSAADGYEETYPAFLGSNWWDRENWVHDDYTLYPRIRLSIAELSYLYLDCYNVDYVLSRMSESNIEVRVRGRKEETKPANGDFTYADVDLRDYFDRNPGIELYRGRLIGYRNNNIIMDSNGPRYPHIILDTPMFASTGEGFRVSDLDIDYVSKHTLNTLHTYRSANATNSAAFVNGEIVNGSISKVTMNFAFSSPIELKGESVGLLATKLRNTSIYGLDINITDSNGSRFMNAELSSVTGTRDFYAGLIAGQAEQDSIIRNLNLTEMNLSKTKLDMNVTSGQLMNVTATSSSSIYVGGLFGDVSKSREALEVNVDVGQLPNDGCEIYVKGPGRQYIGGYFGHISSAETLTITLKENAPKSLANFNITSSGASTVYAGLGFGQIENCSQQLVYNLDKTIEGKIQGSGYSSALGGFVGSVDKALTLTNLVCDVAISGSAGYVGGYIGRTSSSFSLDLSSGRTFSNGISGSNHAGGFVGYASSSVTISLSGYLSLGGSINGSTVGGLVGYCSSRVTIYAHAGMQTSRSLSGSTVGGLVGNCGSMLTVNGSSLIKTNDTISASSVAGGIVGTCGSATITNTSFGGQITMSGSGKVGGKIGESTSSGQISISRSYDYGDVIITSDSGIIYGGLIGSPYGSATIVCNSNYVLTTFYNPYHTSGSVNQHALFGTVATTITGSNNYYNHAVCLLTDEHGTDAGYKTAYEKSASITGGGYKVSSGSTVMTTAITGAVGSFSSGHKLNPVQFASLSSLQSGSSFHGVTYYYLASNLSLSSSLGELSRKTIIGDTYSLSYTGEGGLISNMSSSSSSSRSFLSGVNVKVDITNESASGSMGGLINSMSGGIIYAVGVTGSMDIGGTGTPTIGGFVGSQTGGLISNSFTDIEMLYRAGRGGRMAAFAGSATSGNVEYCYAVGTVECYNDITIDGFSFGNANIHDCYTTANLEWHDYTTAATTPDVGGVSVFSGRNSGNNRYLAEVVPSYGTKNGTAGISMGTSWTSENAYNYGYPTRQFEYLKTSSYFLNSALASASTTLSQINDQSVAMPYWYKQDYNKADVATDQQKGILKAEYTRATRVADITNGYMAIPNAERWRKLVGASGVGTKFILRNDLHMDYNHSGNETSKDDPKNFWLDGQGHRIYDYQGANLFNTLHNATVANVDILRAKVTDKAILAGAISGGIFSNITLSGSLTNASANVGALAATVGSNAKLYSITNNTKIDVIDATDATYVGGIAGQTTFVDVMAYCVNNGPIVVSKKSIGISNVGGLVGQSLSGKITYSYNTTSVANGYINDTNGNYRTGGIVGWVASSTIDHCYNSGMIKSGNKSNGGGFASYAGGISGYNSEGIVTNCINEGPVEALGRNPEWEWTLSVKWLKGVLDDSFTNLIFTPYNSDTFNFATQLALIYADQATLTMKVKSSINVHITSSGIDNSISKLNGCYDTEKTYSFSPNLLTQATVHTIRETNGLFDFYYWLYFKYDYPTGVLVESNDGTGYNFAFTHLQDEYILDNTNCIVTSVDDLGAPRSFYIKLKSFAGETPRFYTRGTLGNDTIQDETHRQMVTNSYRSFEISDDQLYEVNSENKGGELSTFDKKLKDSVLAPYSDDHSETINIGGGVYSFADDTLLDAILNETNQMWTYTFSANTNLPYNSDKKCYSVKVLDSHGGEVSDESLKTTVDSVEQLGSGTKVNIVVKTNTKNNNLKNYNYKISYTNKKYQSSAINVDADEMELQTLPSLMSQLIPYSDDDQITATITQATSTANTQFIFDIAETDGYRFMKGTKIIQVNNDGTIELTSNDGGDTWSGFRTDKNGVRHSCTQMYYGRYDDYILQIQDETGYKASIEVADILYMRFSSFLYGTLPSRYVYNDAEIQYFHSLDNSTIQYEISQVQETSVANPQITELETPTSLDGFILTRNLYLGDIGQKQATFNSIINGNNYLISYYNDEAQESALFSQIDNGGIIKDLNVSGQLAVQGSIVAKTNSGTLKNVNSLGGIRNATGAASGVVDTNSGTLDTVANYAYINGSVTNATISGILNSNSGKLLTSITNNGVLIAANGAAHGKIGADGIKGAKDGAECGKPGGNGDPGGDVYAISAGSLSDSDNILHNNQYIRAGDGGNAGRGGNGGNREKNRPAAGAGAGLPGAKGRCYSYKNLNENDFVLLNRVGFGASNGNSGNYIFMPITLTNSGSLDQYFDYDAFMYLNIDTIKLTKYCNMFNVKEPYFASAYDSYANIISVFYDANIEENYYANPYRVVRNQQIGGKSWLDGKSDNPQWLDYYQYIILEGVYAPDGTRLVGNDGRYLTNAKGYIENGRWIYEGTGGLQLTCKWNRM